MMKVCHQLEKRLSLLYQPITWSTNSQVSLNAILRKSELENFKVSPHTNLTVKFRRKK